MNEELNEFRLKVSADRKRLNRAFANEIEVGRAREFLEASGLRKAVIDFRAGFLGEIGEIKDHISPPDDTGFTAFASVMLEWISPDDLKHKVVTVTVGRSDHRERYLSAVYREIRHYRQGKYDPGSLEIHVLDLGRNFEFNLPISEQDNAHFDEENARLKKWLNEKMLNYNLIWEDADEN